MTLSLLRPGEAGRVHRAGLLAVGVALIAACGSGGGDPATWSIGATEITSETQRFEALVERAGCAGGVTGTVLDPTISRSNDNVTVQFDVEPIGDGPQTCPGNDQVPVVVDLGEALGERTLTDGACLEHAELRRSSTLCDADGVRWSPPSPPAICTTPANDAPLDLALVPTPPMTTGSEGRSEFGAETMAVVEPIVLGTDAGRSVATLRRAGWVVTIVEAPVTTTTATPDLLWNRLVVTVCDDRIEAIAFD